jgi:hypothetical protein
MFLVENFPVNLTNLWFWFWSVFFHSSITIGIVLWKTNYMIVGIFKTLWTGNGVKYK